MKKQDCEQLTFYQGGSPASRSPSPGSAEAQKMTVTSGRKCSELLTNSDPLSSLARMLLVSSRWYSHLVNLLWKAERLNASRTKTTIREYSHNTSDCCSATSSKTSVTSTTPSSFLYFRLVASMPRTDATGYVLLPTPTASDGLQGCIIGEDDTFRTTESGTLRKVNRNGIDGSIGLGRLVQMWPTPTVADTFTGNLTSSQQKPGSMHSVNLSDAVKMWSTPTACEWKGRGPNSKQQGLAEEVKLWVGTPTAQMSSKGRSEKFREGRTPNPVEFAQMFPTPTTPRPHDNESTVGKYYPSQNQFDLTAAVQMLPTPTSRSWQPPSDCHNRQGAADIQTVVNMYPTPTTGAPLCGGSGNYEQLKRLVESGTISEYEKRQMAQQGGGQLSPDWVEWLMGVPQGWTDIEQDMLIPEYDPHWYDKEPDIPRTATGVKSRVDRLKSLGNMVDPYQFFPVMEAIAEILKGLKG